MFTKTNHVELAIQYITSEPDCKVKQISQRLNISPRHLRRLFTKAMGLPPKKFQQQLRFNLAVDLLRSGNYTKLSDVGYQCGYYDQTTFIREFKKRSGGVGPGAFVAERHTHL